MHEVPTLRIENGCLHFIQMYDLSSEPFEIQFRLKFQCMTAVCNIPVYILHTAVTPVVHSTTPIFKVYV